MKPSPLRGNHAFSKFWAADGVSFAGTMVTTVVLPVLVYQRTGSAFETSLLVAIQTVPYLACGLIAGAVADRVDRRRLMYACELISAVLVGSVPVANAFGALTIAHVYLVAAGTATTFVWRDAADFGAIPALVGRDVLASAYSRMASTASVMQIAGPAIGGVLAATIGPAPAMTIDAASYIISGLLLASIRQPFTTADPADHASARLRDRVGEGLRFLWRQPMVRALSLLGFGNSVTLGVLFGLLVVDADQQLGLPRTSSLIGVLYAAGAVGALVASAALPRLNRRFGVVINSLAGRAVEAVLVVAFAVTTNAVAAMILFAGVNAASQLTILVGIIYRQEVTPDHLQGRVNVVARMIAWGGQPFGAVLGGIVASVVSVRAALALSSLGVAVTLLLGLVGPLRLTNAQARLDTTEEDVVPAGTDQGADHGSEHP